MTNKVILSNIRIIVNSFLFIRKNHQKSTFIIKAIMGINQLVKKPSNTPKYISFPQCKQIILDTKDLLDQNKAELKLYIQLFPSSFNYSQQDWGASKVVGSVNNFGISQGTEPEVKQINLTMEQVHYIHGIMKHFRKAQLQEPENRNTVGGDQQEEQKDCCICFNQKASTMLPCGHCYCPECTTKYIIEQQEHRCPQCRRSFHGNKKSFKNSLYQVIHEDKILYETARSQIVECIAKNNPSAARFLQLERNSFQQK